jgi:hypothetical protein
MEFKHLITDASRCNMRRSISSGLVKWIYEVYDLEKALLADRYGNGVFIRRWYEGVYREACFALSRGQG